MAELSLGSILQAAPSLFDFLTQGKLVALLERLIEQFDLLSQLCDRIGYRGMYEILDYGSALEIKDAQGLEACVKRREMIAFTAAQTRKPAGRQSATCQKRKTGEK